MTARNAHGCGPDCTNDDRCGDWARWAREQGELSDLNEAIAALKELLALATEGRPGFLEAFRRGSAIVAKVEGAK